MKRMFNRLHGWALAESVAHEQRLISLGWVEDKPEYSPKFVPAPITSPPGVPPELLGPGVSGVQEPPKRGRPRKVS